MNNFLSFSILFSVLPFFIHVGPNGFSLGERVFFHYRTPGIDLPISIFLILIWTILNFIRNPIIFTNYFLNIHNSLKFYLFFLFLAYSYGFLMGFSNIFLSTSFFMQCIVPIIAFMMGFIWLDTDFDTAILKLDKIFYYWTTIICSFIILQLIQSIVIYGLFATFKEGLIDYIGFINITKIKRYYPFIISLCSVIFFVKIFFVRDRTYIFIINLLFYFLTIFSLFMSWSRSAIIFYHVVSFYVIIIKRKAHINQLTMYLIMFIVIPIIIFSLINLDAIVLERFYQSFISQVLLQSVILLDYRQ